MFFHPFAICFLLFEDWTLFLTTCTIIFLFSQHGQSKKFWEQAAEKMRGINVTTHEADAWGGAGLSGPENVAPALEDSNFSLRAAIQEEIIGYTTTAMETRERYYTKCIFCAYILFLS